jgi:hypothetical protein
MTIYNPPSSEIVRRSIAETTTVTMPQGVYRVGKTTSKRVMLIEREDQDSGNWRIVWQASMRKEIGKRLMSIVTLADAHH